MATVVSTAQMAARGVLAVRRRSTEEGGGGLTSGAHGEAWAELGKHPGGLASAVEAIWRLEGGRRALMTLGACIEETTDERRPGVLGEVRRGAGCALGSPTELRGSSRGS